MAIYEPGYEIHTNRELEFMILLCLKLNGTGCVFMLTRGKPLAHFGDYYPPVPVEEIIPRRAFKPYVESGRFIMRTYVQLDNFPLPNNIRGVLHIFYAQFDEAWRIDRYIEMQIEGALNGWSESLERRQGSLLGYSEDENDLHIEKSLTDPMIQSWPWVRKALQERGQV